MAAVQCGGTTVDYGGFVDANVHAASQPPLLLLLLFLMMSAKSVH